MLELSHLNKKISTLVGILIIVLVAVIAGGILAWQYFGIPEKKETGNETADWKTYRNEDFGLEFKYPENWEVVNESKYQRTACYDPEYRKTDSTCGKHPLVSLGKKDEILLSINLRQCLNIIELPSDHYICFDSALPPDKKGDYLSTTGERLKYLDPEVQDVIDVIKNNFQILE